MAQNLTIRRGETFNYCVQWMSEPFRFIAIKNVSSTMPVTLTVDKHGLTTGTPVDVIRANAKTQETILESAKVIVVDENTLQIDDETTGLKAYTKADYLRVHTYVKLGGMKARCYFKKAIGAPILFEMTTENGRIYIDENTNLITLNIPAKVTEAIEFDSAKYDLELVQDNYFVTRLMEGDITVEGEITVRDEEIGKPEAVEESIMETMLLSDTEKPLPQLVQVTVRDGLKMAGG